MERKIPENPPKKQNLEDCEPGASRSEVFNALKKVANAPKTKPSKRAVPPALTS